MLERVWFVLLVLIRSVADRITLGIGGGWLVERVGCVRGRLVVDE